MLNFIPQLTGHVITYPCCSKRGPIWLLMLLILYFVALETTGCWWREYSRTLMRHLRGFLVGSQGVHMGAHWTHLCFLALYQAVKIVAANWCHFDISCRFLLSTLGVDIEHFSAFFPFHSLIWKTSAILSASWWCYDMETLSPLLTICVGSPLVTSWFPAQRASNVELWCVLCC